MHGARKDEGPADEPQRNRKSKAEKRRIRKKMELQKLDHSDDRHVKK